MNVLITGCSRGIGKAMLDSLNNNSKIKNIFALSSKSDTLIKSKKIPPIQCDFLINGWQEKIIQVVRKVPISLLINNAGYLYNGSIGLTPQSEVLKMFNINVNAPFLIVQSLLENLKNGNAHIINIGSIFRKLQVSRFIIL